MPMCTTVRPSGGDSGEGPEEAGPETGHGDHSMIQDTMCLRCRSRLPKGVAQLADRGVEFGDRCVSRSGQ